MSRVVLVDVSTSEDVIERGQVVLDNKKSQSWFV